MSWTISPLFRGQAVVSDADAQAYLRAVEVADGQPLEAAVASAVNSFVVGCKADGIWTSIKASCILSGARTLSGALVPLVGAAPTNNGFVGIGTDYNRKTGLVGDGTSKYLNANRAGNADPQNSFHQSVFISTAATSGSGIYPVYIGTSGANDRNIYRDQNNGLLSATFNGTGPTITASGSATGFAGQRRSASSATLLRVLGANTTLSSTSAAPLADSIGVFAATGPNLAITRSNARLAFYSIGESLDLTLLDARVTTLINAFSTAIP